METQVISVEGERPRSSRTALIFLSFIIGGIVLLIAGIFLISMQKKETPSGVGPTSVPTLSSKSQDSQSPQNTQTTTDTQASSQTYENPFESPTPEYENPFAENADASTDTSEYENPFAQEVGQ